MQHKERLTRAAGAPVPDNRNSKAAGVASASASDYTR
jgi:hypothetical protein